MLPIGARALCLWEAGPTPSMLACDSYSKALAGLRELLHHIGAFEGDGLTLESVEEPASTLRVEATCKCGLTEVTINAHFCYASARHDRDGERDSSAVEGALFGHLALVAALDRGGNETAEPVTEVVSARPFYRSRSTF